MPLSRGDGDGGELGGSDARRGGRGTAARRDLPGAVAKDDLPWRVIAGFDADIRGHIERDRRIEDERDRVLMASVTLAEVPPEAETEERERARRGLVRRWIIWRRRCCASESSTASLPSAAAAQRAIR